MAYRLYIYHKNYIRFKYSIVIKKYVMHKKRDASI